MKNWKISMVKFVCNKGCISWNTDSWRFVLLLILQYRQSEISGRSEFFSAAMKLKSYVLMNCPSLTVSSWNKSWEYCRFLNILFSFILNPTKIYPFQFCDSSISQFFCRKIYNQISDLKIKKLKKLYHQMLLYASLCRV